MKPISAPLKRSLLALAVSILAAGLLAACQGGTQKFTIHMEEFSYAPETLTVKAGQTVQIRLINDGTVDHEFLLGRGIDEGFEVDFFDNDASRVTVVDGGDYTVGSAEAIAEEGYFIKVEPDGEATISFTVPADKVGEWEIGCFIDRGSHYAAGMHGKFIVEP